MKTLRHIPLTLQNDNDIIPALSICHASAAHPKETR